VFANRVLGMVLMMAMIGMGWHPASEYHDSSTVTV